MANQEEVRDVYGYFEQKGNALCYRYEAERVRIEPWGADSLRVRAWKTAEMDPADWALIKPEKEITPEIEVRLDGANIKGALKQFITNKDNRWNKTNIVPVSNKYYNLTIPQFSIVTLVGKVHL